MLKRDVLSYLAIGVVLLAAFPAAGETPAQPNDSALMSGIYLWQGQQYLKDGRQDLAAEAFVTASEYARSSPYPHFMLARLYARRSLMDAFLEFGAGLKLLNTDFACQSLLVANLLLVTLIAATAAIYMGVLVILVRHARTVWFSMILTYSPIFGEKWMMLMMLAGLGAFILMLSGLSVIAMVTWGALIGSGLAWRYASGSERRMMVAFVTFLVALMPLWDIATRVISTQHPGSATKIAALDRETAEAQIASMEKANNLSPDNDPIGEFMRGFLYLGTGEYRPAIRHFELASRLTRNNAAILNNIGVALHNLGEYRQAEAKFEEALKYGPKVATIHYNYSQTLNALLRYDRAQTELTKASSLDFDLTRSLVTSKDTPAMIPMSLDTGVLWDLALNPRNNMIKTVYHPIEVGWPGLLLLVGLTGSAFALMRRAKLPARCDICGTIVKTQVAKRKRRDILCAECRAIKQVDADDNYAIEKHLQARVARTDSARSVLDLAVGLAIPGSAYHLLGSRIKGVLVSMLFFMLVVVVVSHGGPIRQVPQLARGGFAWAVVLLVATYGLCAWRSVVLVIRNARENRR